MSPCWSQLGAANVLLPEVALDASNEGRPCAPRGEGGGELTGAGAGARAVVKVRWARATRREELEVLRVAKAALRRTRSDVVRGRAAMRAQKGEKRDTDEGEKEREAVGEGGKRKAKLERDKEEETAPAHSGNTKLGRDRWPGLRRERAIVGLRSAAALVIWGSTLRRNHYRGQCAGGTRTALP